MEEVEGRRWGEEGVLAMGQEYLLLLTADLTGVFVPCPGAGQVRLQESVELLERFRQGRLPPGVTSAQVTLTHTPAQVTLTHTPAQVTLTHTHLPR